MKKQEETAASRHTSVLLEETIELLDISRGGVFVDATLGLGGHTEAILTRAGNASVIGIDQDAEAFGLAGERLKKFGARFQGLQANFAELDEVLAGKGVEKIAGIVADLGVSSLQMDSESRGFSFRFDAPLDMRMDPDSGTMTAAEFLASSTEFEIARVIYEYGEERFSRRIARRIVERRQKGEPVETTTQLADLVARCVRTGPRDRIHPATKTFQALRIAVNDEIGILEEFLRTAIDKLEPGGRMTVISFHSLEDRIVKNTFQKLAGKCSCPVNLPICVCGAKKDITVLTRKPLTPAPKEIDLNPRARSAKLRACQKIG